MANISISKYPFINRALSWAFNFLKAKKVSFLAVSTIFLFNVCFNFFFKNDLKLPFETLVEKLSVLFTILLIWEANSYIARKAEKSFPITQQPIKRVAFQLGGAFSFMVVLRSVMMVVFWDFFLEFSRAFMATVFIMEILFVILVHTSFISLEFFQAWKSSLIEAERLKKENLQSQLEALKNQVNPHFLFNSFTTLNELIFENTQKASDYLEKLASTYRYLLQNNINNLVTLKEEIEFIDNYIYLLKIRYEDSLYFNIKIDEAALAKKIPPVSLQILLENAIKHNVINLNNPLWVEIYTRDNYLFVKNNVNPKTSHVKSNHIGLQNLKERISLLKCGTMEVEQNTEEFKVKLPLSDQ
jgi:two-component system, LytTR family, sensor kinase